MKRLSDRDAADGELLALAQREELVKELADVEGIVFRYDEKAQAPRVRGSRRDLFYGF